MTPDYGRGYLHIKMGAAWEMPHPKPPLFEKKPVATLMKLYYIVLLEQVYDDIVRKRLLEQSEDGHDGRQQELSRLLAVEELARCVQQVAHIVNGAPDLGNAAVNIAQRVDCFHAGTDGVLGGENGVARCVGKLTDEREVYRAVGNYLGTVALCSGHEEGGYIRHHARSGIALVGGKIHDLILGDTDVVQPLCGKLNAGALVHRLFDEVAFVVPAVKTVDPDQAVVGGLLLELTLTVDGPAYEPARVAAGHDAAGDDLAGQRITLADLLDSVEDLLVCGVDGPGLPGGLLDAGEELLGTAERRILSRDLLPHLDGGTLAVLTVTTGAWVLSPYAEASP